MSRNPDINGGTAVDRPSWADDVEMDWLVSTVIVFQSARRLIHETGLYEKAFDEVDQLGLLGTPSLDVPAPGPESALLRTVRDAREGELEPAATPRSWVEGLIGQPLTEHGRRSCGLPGAPKGMDR